MGPGALLLSSCRLEVSGASRGEAGGGELALGALGEGGRCAWVAARSVTGLCPSTSAQPPLVCDHLRGAGGCFFLWGAKRLVSHFSGDVPSSTDGPRRARIPPAPPVSGGGLGSGGLAGGLWVSGLAGRFVDAEALGSSR